MALAAWTPAGICLIFGASMLLSVLPLIIVLSTYASHRVQDDIARHLGLSAQGVRVGDYFRVFRYQGTHIETNYQVRDTAYKIYGYGSTPVAYEWNNLPRQVLGEGIVLQLGPNSSTVMLTTVREEIFAGDYVELE